MPRFVTIMIRWGEMVKFSHSVFALPFALMATFLAGRSAFIAGTSTTIYPGVAQIGLIILCMVAARSAAMTFNRCADAAIDARNPRTAGRAIPAGIISKRQAIVFFMTASVLFVLACAGFYLLDGNAWPVLLSGPVLAYLCFYSYTKRFTRWSHFVLGSSIGLSPAAAWMAIDPASLGWSAVILCGAVTFWIGGFDVIYACQDVETDRREGLYSLPAGLGVGRALWVARTVHVLTVVLLVILGFHAGLGWIYAVGVVIVTLLLLVENALVGPNRLARVNLAFFTMNSVVGVILGLATILDIVLDLRPVFST